jgi:hypothetical protein
VAQIQSEKYIIEIAGCDNLLYAGSYGLLQPCEISVAIAAPAPDCEFK